MSFQTFDKIMKRIRFASKDSPIAVFADPLCRNNMYEAVFGATQTTWGRIKDGDPLFIGMFDMSMSKNKVLEKINNALRDIAA